MSAAPGRILLVFIDGIGIGAADPATNPFAAARLPQLRELLAGRLPFQATVAPGAPILTDHAVLVAADALLGVPGRPQSGTGQTALLTGLNAPRIFGRHFGSWVPTPLRELLGRASLLRRAADGGREVVYANAHPPGVGFVRRPSAPPLAAHLAGLRVRSTRELRAGEAIASSITNEFWRERLPDAGIPQVSTSDAAAALARLASSAELTLFAHFDTDFFGHRGSLREAAAALERLDEFLGALFARLPDDTLLIVASDHGNIEDVESGHTMNFVPVLASGPGQERIGARVGAITDVTPVILELLGVE